MFRNKFCLVEAAIAFAVAVHRYGRKRNIFSLKKFCVTGAGEPKICEFSQGARKGIGALVFHVMYQALYRVIFIVSGAEVSYQAKRSAAIFRKFAVWRRYAAMRANGMREQANFIETIFA